MADIIKQIEHDNDGEYCVMLYTVKLEDDETIEEALAWHFGATYNTSAYDCTGKWYASRGRVVDTCCDMFLVRQAFSLDV